jgi:hypothetical protein
MLRDYTVRTSRNSRAQSVVATVPALNSKMVQATRHACRYFVTVRRSPDASAEIDTRTFARIRLSSIDVGQAVETEDR